MTSRGTTPVNGGPLGMTHVESLFSHPPGSLAGGRQVGDGQPPQTGGGSEILRASSNIHTLFTAIRLNPCQARIGWRAWAVACTLPSPGLGPPSAAPGNVGVANVPELL